MAVLKSFCRAGFLLWITGAYSQITIDKIADLPGTINETSGLIYFNGSLVTHNDSGNDAALYELDPDVGSIKRTVALSNATNIDWEDLTQDANYIYIGDFGNNNGDRTDLKIYRIAKSAYTAANTVFAEEIQFTYSDQANFTPNPETNWDAEAMISLEGKLIVFTKQWQDLGTVAYSIPSTPGTHTATRLDSYQVDGLITGATYDANSEQLSLVGYSPLLMPFLVQVELPPESSIFSGSVTKTTLDLGLNQIEAITHFGNGFFLSAEEFRRTIPTILVPSSLYAMSIMEETDPDPEPDPNPEPDVPNPDAMFPELTLYQPMGTLSLNYNLNEAADLFGYAIFDISGKKILVHDSDSSLSGSIDTSFLQPSIYFISFHLRNGRIAKPFIIK
ncbi:T9SS type A sorting domain-containing protein [Flagellimonas myxillae]|uniref:T9SS type A sorting domain-containing protein n=1 Tax=Flagellimonas myxillae TaxID=2942214 RepID=UPI00201EAFA1|nr:T9SS type A sorting domain-containing protein [Muricauda myxillae]MCL6266171.1 T9SS type A sorting domain-containing protein [Muricauda myxillae]